MTTAERLTPLDLLAAHQATLDSAEQRALEHAQQRNAALWDAHLAGATYPTLAKATGLSVTRVTQILRRERMARGVAPYMGRTTAATHKP